MSAINQKTSIDFIYLDVSKAFDKVPITRLLYKMKILGIRGQVNKWIDPFLKGRRQRVILRKGVSEWMPVVSGVPQGSILGSVGLLLYYVNDLPDVVKSS